MPSASRPTFLRHFSRAISARRGPDLADMGTAFALDLSMDQDDSVTPADSPPPRVRPVSRWRVWLGRKLGA